MESGLASASRTFSVDDKRKTTTPNLRTSCSLIPESAASQTLAHHTATAHLSPAEAASSPSVTSTQISPAHSASSPLSSPSLSLPSSQEDTAPSPRTLSAERSTTTGGAPDYTTLASSATAPPPASATAAPSPPTALPPPPPPATATPAPRSASASPAHTPGPVPPSHFPSGAQSATGLGSTGQTTASLGSSSSTTGQPLHGNIKQEFPLPGRELLSPSPEDVRATIEAIETERLRKKNLEWYLHEIMREKEALIQAQGKERSAPASQTQISQQVMDGVDNYMFTKKRRLSFVSNGGSLSHALQPPLKKLSLSVDDSCISDFLSFPEDEHQGSAKSTADAAHQLSGAASSSSTAVSSAAWPSFGSEITVPPASADSTSLTPRRPSLCLNPSGSLSFKPSTGSFSINLPGSGPLSNGKNSLSWDPLTWAQSETASNGYPCNMDYRLSSFDLNMWTNDDQLKETLTEFFDF